MLKMPWKGKTAFLRRFMLSYIIILIIPLIFASYAYHETIKTVEMDAIQSRLSLLRQTRDMIDKYLIGVDDMVLQIAMDPKLKQLLYISQPSGGSPEIFNVWNYAKDLNSRTVTNDLFKSKFYIFLKNSDIVFSHNSTIFGFRQFYENELSYQQLKYEEWSERLFDKYLFRSALPAQKILNQKTEGSAITYMYSLPMAQGSSPQGAIAFLINEDEIKKLLLNISVDQSGWVSVMDEKGQLICGVSQEGQKIEDLSIGTGKFDGYFHRNVAGKEMIYVYTHSTYNNWTYAAAIPFNSVMEKVHYIKQMAIAAVSISLLIGLLCSLYLAYRNTKTFRSVLATLKDFITTGIDKTSVDENTNEYEFLQGSITDLIQNTKIMQDSLQRQSQSFKTILFDRLLKGDFDDKKRFEALLLHNGINTEGNQFVVMLIKINRYDQLINNQILEELDIFRILIEDILSKNVRESYYLHIVNENEMVLLLNLSEPDREQCILSINNLVQSVNKAVFEQYRLNPIFGIGNIYYSLLDAHYSYKEAKQALNFHQDLENNQCIVWYSAAKNLNYGYFYPTDVEIKLINCAKAGKYDEIEVTMSKICYENFKVRSISKTLEEYLLYDMQTTIFKLLSEVRIEVDLHQLEDGFKHTGDFNKTYEIILRSFKSICNAVEDSKKSHNEELREKILAFIHENYMNASLSAYSIASNYHLSESYFSQFFKEQTGMTFISYVEDLRIQLACRLMSEGNISVEEVAEKTGYNSTHSFRRAFKRVIGVVPSEYIQSNNPNLSIKNTTD